MDFFRIKNFEKYNGKPGTGSRAWVKIHKKIIVDYEYAQLHDSHKATFLHLCLNADAVDNRFPYDTRAIKRQCNLNSNVNLDILEKAGFIEKISQKNPIRQDKTRQDKTRQDGEKQKKKERKKTSLDRYHDLFKEKFGTKPLIQKKHGPIFADLEKKMGREEIVDLVERYFKTEDKYIIESGYTIELFGSQINKLIASRKAKPVPTNQNNRTYNGRLRTPEEQAEYLANFDPEENNENQ